VELYAQNETALRRVAHRFSLCTDDAEDALQRGLEILLHKAPTDDPRQLIKWLQTVIRHEALAIRHERERTLPAAAQAEPGREDWVSLLPATTDGPPERAERQEAVGRWREALKALKPQELQTLTLLAEGYSYAEIGEITGYSQTKVNRCLAEGRERFRSLVAGSENGTRCAEMRPLLSAFCDGEAKGEGLAELREHLRACARCRATLRTYRAAPAAAVVLLPSLPPRSLWERVQDAYADLFGRLGGGGETVARAATGSGAGGVAAVAKIAAVCVAAAGGAAACLAGGLVPAPLDLGPERERPRIERHPSEIPAPETPEPQIENAPAPTAKPKPQPSPDPSPPAPTEVEPVAAEPAPAESGDATEYVPPPAPEPVAEPAPVSSSGTGSPAGEFGP
jgi:RNA polymerase sigma factor (sigma-70 family)